MSSQQNFATPFAFTQNWATVTPNTSAPEDAGASNEPPELLYEEHLDASLSTEQEAIYHAKNTTSAEHAEVAPYDKTVLDDDQTKNTQPNSSFKDSTAAAVVQKQNFIARFFAWLIPAGSITSNCFSLGSVTLGGGIISMPSSFATSGILMGVIYLLIINIITIYTMTMLGYAMKMTDTRTFENTAKLLFGRGWDYFTGFVIWLSCFGTAIAYISAASGLVDPVLQNAPHTPEYLKTLSGNRLITSMLWLFFMVPVVIPKRVNSIRYVSAIGCMMVLYFVITIVVHSCTNGLKEGMRDDMVLFTTGNKAIYGLSIFIFAYLCQAIAHQVYFEMKPAPSIRRLTVASAIAMSVCTVFYLFAGIFGYFDFASKTQDSILYNFDPVHQPYVMVAYIGMFVKICAAYAMNMIPCRDFIYHCLRWNLDTVPYWKHILAVLMMSFIVLICGLFIPSINLAFGLVGSLCGGFIGFIFPALFWMYCGNWSLKTVGIWHWLGTYFVLVCGVIAIVFGTIATIYSSFIDTG